MNWLDRKLMIGPYLILCLNEAAYQAAMAHCKIEYPEPFPDSARADVLKKGDSHLAIIVSVNVSGMDSVTPVQMSALLVHEAVHVFQHFCQDIGENRPSIEFEAYSIQAIYQTLALDYVRQIGGTDEPFTWGDKTPV